MNENVPESIYSTLDELDDTKKLVLIERLARSMRKRSGARTAAEQKADLERLFAQLDMLPVKNPNDGFSNRDHDKVLYGERA
jgi:hypothetical protein